MPSKERRSSNRTLKSDQCTLDQGLSGHNPQRDDSGLNEINLLNPPPWLMENHAFPQDSGLNKLAHRGKVRRR